MTEPIKLPPPSKKLVERWSDTPPVYYWDEAGVRAAIGPYTKRIAELEAENAELKRLCEKTYVAQGADAYNHARRVEEES